MMIGKYRRTLRIRCYKGVRLYTGGVPVCGLMSQGPQTRLSQSPGISFRVSMMKNENRAIIIDPRRV